MTKVDKAKLVQSLGIALSTTKGRELKGKHVRREHGGLSSPTQQKGKTRLLKQDKQNTCPPDSVRTTWHSLCIYMKIPGNW